VNLIEESDYTDQERAEDLEADWNEDDALLDEKYSYMDLFLAAQEAPLPEPVTPISLEELLREQLNDPLCQKLRARLDKGEGIAYLDDIRTGVLTRIACAHDQVVVPKKLRARILNMAHHSRAASHPGGKKMYRSLQRAYYWPSMAVDAYVTVKGCNECAKERVAARARNTQLKLFPAAAPLEDVAMDLLGELVTTPRGKKHILVITDRFSKLVRVVALSSIKAIDIAKAFTKHWVFAYGPPKTILTDNGPQFAAKLLLEVDRILGIRAIHTSAYHPETNGQTERYNRTLVSALRKFVADHPRSWDMWIDVVTHAYNTQVHTSTGVAPFELVTSRPPPTMWVETDGGIPESPRLTEIRWLRNLRLLVESTRNELQKQQARYKANFDARIANAILPQDGDWVYIRQGVAPAGVTIHKLTPKSEGPFKVYNCDYDAQTFEIEREGTKARAAHRETININRAVVCPAPTDAEEDEDHPLVEGLHTAPTSEGSTPAGATATPSAAEPVNENSTSGQPPTAPAVETTQPEDTAAPAPENAPSPSETPAGQSAETIAEGTTPSGDHTTPDQEENASPSRAPATPTVETSEERVILGEYVVDRITDHAQDPTGSRGDWVVQVKWLNHTEKTWEPLEHVRRSQVALYCRRFDLAYPPNMDATRSG